MQLFKMGVRLGVIALCACAALGAQARPAPTVLETSNRLQVMAQRQARLFLQLRLAVDAETSQQKLDEAIRHFDAGLVQLRANSGDAPLIDQVTVIWGNARLTLSEAADPRTAAKAAKDAEMLTQALKRVADQQLPPGAGPALKMSTLAARDAMLVQRLAKIYLQLRAGDGDVDRKAELAQTRKEFLDAIEVMDRSPVSRAGDRSNIELVRQQWAFFETAVSSSSVDTKTMRTVVSTSERISQTLADITSSYQMQAVGEAALLQAAR